MICQLAKKCIKCSSQASARKIRWLSFLLYICSFPCVFNIKVATFKCNSKACVRHNRCFLRITYWFFAYCVLVLCVLRTGPLRTAYGLPLTPHHPWILRTTSWGGVYPLICGESRNRKTHQIANYNNNVKRKEKIQACVLC